MTVTLSAASGFTVTADYTADGSSSQFCFAPGATRYTITAPVTDDLSDQPDTVIPLVLSNPINGRLGSRATAALTIVDIDPRPRVQFNSTSYSIAEDRKTVTVTVIFSPPLLALTCLSAIRPAAPAANWSLRRVLPAARSR